MYKGITIDMLLKHSIIFLVLVCFLIIMATSI